MLDNFVTFVKRRLNPNETTLKKQDCNMNLSLKEASTVAGLSIRQLRYQIQSGKIKANKINGKWCIPKEQLPLSPGREQAQQQKLERVADIAHQVLRTKKSKRYSLLDLRAYTLSASLYQEIGSDSVHQKAKALLLEAMLELACACHAYNQVRKSHGFALARDHLCQALVYLHLESPTTQNWMAKIEQEIIPAIGGLLRHVERKKH